LSNSDVAVWFGDDVGSFLNAGTIRALYNGSSALQVVDGRVDRFVNAGSIIGVNEGIRTYDASFGLVTNTGTIEGYGYGLNAVNVGFDDGFMNLGTLSGVYGIGASFEAGFNYDHLANFTNGTTGEIAGMIGLAFDGYAVGDLVNHGSIAGYLFGIDALETDFASIVNTGTIRGVMGAGISIYDGDDTTVVNSGTIEGDYAIVYDVVGGVGSTIVNSGTLRGTGGTAVDFDYSCICGGVNRDDSLTIVAGSRIFGSVNFGGSADTDTLDFSEFNGNTVLDVFGLETTTPGSVGHFDFRDGNGDGQIVIFDLDWLGQHSIGQSQLDIVAGINAFVRGNAFAGQLPAGSFTTAYAESPALTPAADAAESAVLSEIDVTTRDPVTIWGGALAGGYSGASPSALGGLVAGAHAAVSSRLSAGLLGASLVSSTSLAGGTQTLASATAALGAYGTAELGPATIDFSLLAGAQAHESRREVVAGGTTETARGLFTSLFIAPSAGVTVPVLEGEQGTLAVATSASAVMGAATGYTETGSSANLTVGGQTISAFDGRIGVAGHRAAVIGDGIAADLSARTGLFAQLNGGSASVPVAFGGQSLSVATPGASALGFYAGGGIDATLTDRMNFSLAADAEFRSDGRAGVSVSAGLTGAF
jgi:hypothetical protein